MGLTEDVRRALIAKEDWRDKSRKKRRKRAEVVSWWMRRDDMIFCD